MAGFTRAAALAKPLETKYLYGRDRSCGCAFRRADTILFRLRVPEGTVCAEMLVTADDTGEHRCFSMEKEAEAFSLSLSMETLCAGAASGLFFYKYRVSGLFGTYELFMRPEDFSQYYGEEIASRFDFQLLVYEEREVPPEWFCGGILYQIFPDRFSSAGERPIKSGAVLCRDRDRFPTFLRDREENKKNNVFFGGDLAGIEKKLDYLASLGVTALYLNPIFESPSNHRYDTADYRHVDEMLGGDEAFDRLLKAARKHGMEIILDGVFNHTGSDSIYFNAKGTYGSGGAAQTKDSPYYSWYTFERYPDRYDAWWDIHTLPRVRSDNPIYREFLFGREGVVRQYMKKGIAGWRLDVADELSDDFLREFTQTVLEEKPDALVLGEVWEDATTKVAYGERKRYLRGGELDSVMNYPVRQAIIDYLIRGDFMALRRTLLSIYGHYPPPAANTLMNILGTHDTERILTALGDGTAPQSLPYAALAEHEMRPEERVRGKELLRLAVCIQMLLPGVPCIFYGDEAGIEGYGDPFCRRPYPWEGEDQEILSFYRAIGSVRRSERTILAHGAFVLIYVDIDLLCFERQGDGETLVILVNRGEEEYEFYALCKGVELLSGESGERFSLAPAGCAVIRVPQGTDYSVSVKIGKDERK